VPQFVPYLRGRFCQNRLGLDGGEVSCQNIGKLLACLSGSVAVIGAASLTASPAAAAGCQGPGAPNTGHTKCVTAIHIPGNPLQSFDISWVDPKTSRYYLSDRANAGIDVIDTSSLTFLRTLGGFVGIVIKNGAVDNSHSGPDGVTTHGRWLYAGTS
jgi:hypothetical protein